MPVKILIAAALVTLLLAAGVAADVPQQISYQGRLTNSDGSPVFDGTYNLTFQIVEHDPPAMGETPLWSSGVQPVTVTNGLFEYYLGSNVPLPLSVFTDDTLDGYYIRVLDEGSLVASQGIELTAVPFAYRAITADTAAYALAGPGGGGANGWVDDGAVVRLQNSVDRVGIGTASPGENLVVGGDLGSFPEANYVVSGNPDFEGFSGYKLGFNASNHATLNWYGDADRLAFSVRSGGTDYNNNLVLRAGNVGIGVDYPQEPLVVGTNLGTYYGDFVQIGRLGSGSYSGFMCGEDANNRGTVLWYNDSNELRLGGKYYGADHGATMVLKEGNVGIGNTSPSEPLSVGVDLGSFSGDRITIGDDTPGEQTGLVFGESALSRGWLLWDINNNYLSLGLCDAGTQYNNLMVLQDGTVGIGGNYSTAKLHVESEYEVALGVTRYGMFNNVIVDGAGTTLGLHSHVHHVQHMSPYIRAVICAVDGYATAINPSCTTSIGVRGESWGAINCYGLYGLVNTHTNFGIGVYAHAQAAEDFWAAVLDGPVDMPGNSFRSAAYTRIDHPLDPENKYLQHASVESDEMLNVYNGNVILDGSGEATVELPGWFEAFNWDFRYQLTCVGGYAPVYIAEKVRDNRFRIAGGTPGLEVSWQVSGVRQDPYAQVNQLEVEPEKSLRDRGRYRSPSAFGRNESESIYQVHRTTRAEDGRSKK